MTSGLQRRDAAMTPASTAPGVKTGIELRAASSAHDRHQISSCGSSSMREQRGDRRAEREQRLQDGIAGVVIREQHASRALSPRHRWNSTSATNRGALSAASVFVAVDLAHEIGRTAAHFKIDAADVFADQPQREENESDEHEQYGEQHPQCALFLRTIDQAMPGQKQHQQRIEEKDSDSEQASAPGSGSAKIR